MAEARMYIASPERSESDAIPTYSDTSLRQQRLRQVIEGGTPTDSGYLSIPMNAAVSLDFLRFDLDAHIGQFSEINSITLRVRFRFLGWTTDTTNIQFIVEPSGESGISQSVAASTAAWQTFSFTDSVPNAAFNNLDDSTNWQFFMRTSGYSGSTDTITCEVAAVEVIIDYTPRPRSANVAAVSALQAETGTVEVNFNLPSLPSTKQRKIVFIETGESATQTVTAKYNGSGGTAFTAINDGAVPSLAMDGNYYMNVSYFDVPNADTGVKSIYWTPRPNSNTARAIALILEYVATGDPQGEAIVENEQYDNTFDWGVGPSRTGRGVAVSAIGSQSTIAAAGRPVHKAHTGNNHKMWDGNLPQTAWFEWVTSMYGGLGWQVDDDSVSFGDLEWQPQDGVTGSRIASTFTYFFAEDQAIPAVTDVDTDETITADQLNVVATGTNMSGVVKAYVDGKEQSIDSVTETTVQFDAVDFAEGDSQKYGSNLFTVVESF